MLSRLECSEMIGCMGEQLSLGAQIPQSHSPQVGVTQTSLQSSSKAM
jgi:hypothetical protein